MYSEPDLGTAARMRAMHQTASALLRCTWVETERDSEKWGWHGRSLSRPVDTAAGQGWLRLVSASADRAGGKLWEGPQEAERSMPPEVPRPHLRARRTWVDDEYGYLAELYEKVPGSVISPDSPVLTHAPELDDAWWSDLAKTVDAIATVTTTRVAVRQEYLDRAMPRYLGIPIETTVSAWSTAHGDFHWANLTRPRLSVLDWEGWGLAPAGYDAALLHAYSLLAPKTAAEVRLRLGHVLDTPSGRFAELVVITELLQSIERGDHPELREPLLARVEELRT